MADIFISYKKEDKAKARMFADAFERNGWSVWWDLQIPAGSEYDDAIEEALNAARCVVVLWSSRSIKSRWVKTEAEEGSGREILVPVLIDKVKPPLAFRRVQAADLSDWEGDPGQSEFKFLLEAIEGVTGKPELQVGEPPEVAKTDHESANELIPKSKHAPRENVPANKNKVTHSSPASRRTRKSKIVLACLFAACFLTVGPYLWFNAQHRMPPVNPAPEPVDPDPAPKSVDPEPAAEPVDPEPAPEPVDPDPAPKPPDPPDIEWGMDWESGWESDWGVNLDKDKIDHLEKKFANRFGMEFVLIPAGRYKMGGDDSSKTSSEDDIIIKNPFYIQTSLVTKKQWRDLMAKDTFQRRFNDIGDRTLYGPKKVMHWEINKFVEKIGEKGDRHYRIPTEAELKYVAMNVHRSPIPPKGLVMSNGNKKNLEHHWNEIRQQGDFIDHVQWVKDFLRFENDGYTAVGCNRSKVLNVSDCMKIPHEDDFFSEHGFRLAVSINSDD